MSKKVQLEILGLSQNPTSTGAFALVLKEADGDRRLPIIIGAPEAGAIAYELEGTKNSRPMTHDLLKSTIEALGESISEVCIVDLKDSTFYASIRLEPSGNEIDSRPSDAIAMAVRFDAPIYVMESILEEAGFVSESESAEEEESEESLLSEDEDDDPVLKAPTKEVPNLPLTKLELMQSYLQKAIEKEEYEKAAQLRDEIEKLKQAE